MASISKFMTKKLLDAGITGYILKVYQKLSLMHIWPHRLPRAKLDSNIVYTDWSVCEKQLPMGVMN